MYIHVENKPSLFPLKLFVEEVPKQGEEKVEKVQGNTRDETHSPFIVCVTIFFPVATFMLLARYTKGKGDYMIIF